MSNSNEFGYGEEHMEKFRERIVATKNQSLIRVVASTTDNNLAKLIFLWEGKIKEIEFEE